MIDLMDDLINTSDIYDDYDYDDYDDYNMYFYLWLRYLYNKHFYIDN